MVGTFEKGLETSPAPCTKKTGFHRVHQTLVSTGPERPINGSCEDAGVGLRPDAGYFVTGCWRGASSPADKAAHRGDTV